MVNWHYFTPYCHKLIVSMSMYENITGGMIIFLLYNVKSIYLGHFCKLATQHPEQYPCSSGSWSNLTNLEKESDCYECPKGMYCIAGSAAPTGICPTGHYCPPGMHLSS